MITALDYKTVALGEVLNRVERFEEREEFKEYPFAGTYSFAGGIFASEVKQGSTFKLPKIQRIHAGDFVYCKIMAWEGAFGLVPEAAHNCVMSGAFVVYEPDKAKIDPRYLAYYFRLPHIWQSIGSQSTGTNIRRRSLHPKQFESVRISLPSLSEQRRIVARIEELAARIEEARGLRRQAVEEADALYKSELADVFITLEEQVGSQALKYLISNANYGTSTKCQYERMGNAVPVLRIPNVARERVSLSDIKYGVLRDAELGRVLVYSGDILIVRTNGSADLVGRCAVVPSLHEPTAFASYIIRLRCDTETVNPNYLQLMLKHLRTNGQLIDFARTTAGQFNISLGRLRAATLPVPTLMEQQSIVAYLDDLQAKVDSLKQLQAETAAELDALLPSVLDRAFRGKL